MRLFIYSFCLNMAVLPAFSQNAVAGAAPKEAKIIRLDRSKATITQTGNTTVEEWTFRDFVHYDEWHHYYVEVERDDSEMTAETWGWGDVDLYVRKNSDRTMTMTIFLLPVMTALNLSKFMAARIRGSRKPPGTFRFLDFTRANTRCASA